MYSPGFLITALSEKKMDVVLSVERMKIHENTRRWRREVERGRERENNVSFAARIITNYLAFENTTCEYRI